MNYSAQEYQDMVTCYGWAEGNGELAARRYRELFPNRNRFPAGRTIAGAFRRAHEGDIIPHRGRDGGRVVAQRIPRREEVVIAEFDANPRSSSRVVGRLVGMSQSTVNRITRSENLRPYHLNPVQELRDGDPAQRLNFCRWVLQRFDENPDFFYTVLFTDESNFDQSGVRNCHNEHFYADQNPHATRVRTHQIRYSANMWGGILGRQLVSNYTQLFSCSY